MVEGLIPALMGAMELAGAGIAAKGTMDMMNSGKGKPKVLDDDEFIAMGNGLWDAPMKETESKKAEAKDDFKIPEELQREIPLEALKKISPEMIKKLAAGLTYNKIKERISKKKAEAKDTFKTPEEIQDVIDNGSHLSISNHPDKDGILTTLGMAGLGSPELRRIGKTGAISADTLKKLSPELMKDLATGLGLAQGSRTTSIPVPEEDLGSDYQLVSGKDIAKQVRGSESYANMMADFDPDPENNDEEEEKDKKNKKRKLDRKVDDASEKFADAMNRKITKNDAEKLADIAREGQRLDVKPNAMKDLINKGGRFAHDWRQAESLLRKVGGDAAKPLIDKLYKGTYTAEEMQQLEEAVSSLASVAKDVLMH